MTQTATVLAVPADTLTARFYTANDPAFLAARTIAETAQREAHLRRAAAAARTVLDVLPTAATLTFNEGRCGCCAHLIAVRDASGAVLLAADFDVDVPEGVKLPNLDEATKLTVEDSLHAAASWEAFPTVDVEHPDWDINESDVFVVDLLGVLAQVAALDEQKALKNAAPQYRVCVGCGGDLLHVVDAVEAMHDFTRSAAAMALPGETVDGKPFEHDGGEDFEALNGLVRSARELLGMPPVMQHVTGAGAPAGGRALTATARTVASLAKQFVENHDTIRSRAFEALTCPEADDLALLLALHGHTDAASLVLCLHAIGDFDIPAGLEHTPLAAAVQERLHGDEFAESGQARELADAYVTGLVALCG
ncbi:hypothetical protein [Actinoplanes sp. URMC 104]|uniref:hypothetical protein n=1 Tax=Actinoplanes sp. URMC 104 TaxID=3423409 RepID=UPI003F1D5664